MAAALQQSPVTFRPQIPSTAELCRTSASLNPSHRSAFLGRFPTLTTSLSARKKPLRLRRIRRGGPTMMDTAASSYATALADVAKSNGTLEATSADVEKVEKIFADEQVLNFFTNPTIDLAKKRQVIDEIAKSSALKPHTVNFLNILLEMKRIDLIKDIVKEFEVVYNKLTNTELAIVTSVVKLESAHLAQIAQGVQRLTGAKNVRIKTVIDPSLVAGFTIRYGSSGSKLIDMSVKKQLDEIASKLDFKDMVASLAS